MIKLPNSIKRGYAKVMRRFMEHPIPWRWYHIALLHSPIATATWAEDVANGISLRAVRETSGPCENRVKLRWIDPEI